MQLFFEILTQITLPILMLVGLGWAVQHKMQLDLDTLTRFQIFIITPCAIVHFLISADLPLTAASGTAVFTVLQFFAFIALGFLGARLAGLSGGMRTVIALAPALANSGNYGIPLIQLSFGDDYLLHQTVVLAVHTILIMTVAVWIIGRGAGQNISIMGLILSPLILAVAAGLLIKGFNLPLPALITVPLRLMGSAFTAIALFILGAQLAESAGGRAPVPLTIALTLKLLVAPALTWLLAWLLGFPDDLIALFVVGASAPVAVFLAILATQHRSEPSFTSSVVFLSTLLSPLAVTGWILAVRLAGLV